MTRIEIEIERTASEDLAKIKKDTEDLNIILPEPANRSEAHAGKSSAIHCAIQSG